MAALSDGVIAVVITIMVLELKIPERDLSDLEGLRKVAPIARASYRRWDQAGNFLRSLCSGHSRFLSLA
jgi:hypothetical protein